jgi:ribonuclease P protein component
MKKTVPLNKNYEFMRAYKKGKFYVGKYIILYAIKNNCKLNRLGITVNKKIGKSVKRNRVKRLIKESYRFYENFIKNDFDLVFVARNQEVIPRYLDIIREMKFLLKKLDVYDQGK